MKLAFQVAAAPYALVWTTRAEHAALRELYARFVKTDHGTTTPGATDNTRTRPPRSSCSNPTAEWSPRSGP